MPKTREFDELRAVFEAKAAGLTDREVSCLTGVPITTIRGWRNRRLALSVARRESVSYLDTFIGPKK